MSGRAARRAIGVGVALLLVLAIALFYLLSAPSDPSGTEVVAPVRTPESRAKPRVIRTRRDDFPAPSSPAEEGLYAIARATGAALIRCSVSPGIDARQTTLKHVVWEGDQMTAAVSKPRGRSTLTWAHKERGTRTAGWFRWEGATPGTIQPCTFEPARPVAIEVEVRGYEAWEKVQLIACHGAIEIPVEDGRAVLDLPAGERCDVRVVGDPGGTDSNGWKRLTTRTGERTMVQRFEDGPLVLELVDRDTLSEEEFDAIRERSAEIAIGILHDPAMVKTDIEEVVRKNPDLSEEAIAWLENHFFKRAPGR